MPTRIPDFSSFTASHLQKDVLIYHKGEGPPVILLPEIPGLHQSVVELGRRIVNAGFCVYMPALFGEVNKPFRYIDSVIEVARACIKKEFYLFSAHRPSPLTNWVREFCTSIHQKHPGKGVGLIGMCITGNFALSLIAEPWMMAPVLSQPSLPFGISKKHKSDLHVDPEILEKAKEREDLKLLALRFTGDPFCSHARFACLRQEFGDRLSAIEIDSSRGNPHGIRSIAHSVLTKDFVDQEGHPTHKAAHDTIRFLQQRLLSADEE